MKQRICVLTAGHLATTPRMVKAADALADEGYDVSVVSARFVEWADAADRDILVDRGANWSWKQVDYRRHGALPRYVFTGLRFHFSRRLARAATVRRLGLGLAARARDRVFPELVSAALATHPEMIYGGGNALAATAVAAARARVPFALDLEDLHSAQDPPDDLYGMTERIERQILPRAALLTAGSRAIAEAYRSKYGVDPVPIHNVFPLPDTPPTEREGDDSLRLYWFGQTIGPGRGIEDAIRGAGLAGVRVEIFLRGLLAAGYWVTLESLAAESGPLVSLTYLPPAAPLAMVDLCRPYDVGLALERRGQYQAVSLSNKALTYILAGLAVAMTDTPGQHELGASLGEGAILCKPYDSQALASGLKRWAEDRWLLSRAKAAAWDAARRRWHWEHPEERGTLLKAVAAVFA